MTIVLKRAVTTTVERSLEQWQNSLQHIRGKNCLLCKIVFATCTANDMQIALGLTVLG